MTRQPDHTGGTYEVFGDVILDTANLGNSIAIHLGKGNCSLSIDEARDLADDLTTACQRAREVGGEETFPMVTCPHCSGPHMAVSCPLQDTLPIT